MKLVIGDPSTGKTYQVEVPKDKEGLLIGRKVGDAIDGSSLGAAGYTLKITGGSDTAGFPMRHDVSGPRRAKLLLSDSPGFRKGGEGDRQARRVRGNIISDEIEQINCKVKEKGPKPLDELFGKKESKEEKK
ncbi:MAG: 30S ribosomal protein S6e [Candidatus Micrarchaeota archaeon]